MKIVLLFLMLASLALVNCDFRMKDFDFVKRIIKSDISEMNERLKAVASFRANDNKGISEYDGSDFTELVIFIESTRANIIKKALKTALKMIENNKDLRFDLVYYRSASRGYLSAIGATTVARANLNVLTSRLVGLRPMYSWYQSEYYNKFAKKFEKNLNTFLLQVDSITDELRDESQLDIIDKILDQELQRTSC